MSFKKLFALAAEIAPDMTAAERLEILRSGAAKHTGQPSLKSLLKKGKLAKYEQELQQHANELVRKRKRKMKQELELHDSVRGNQQEFIYELVTYHFRSVRKFRTWLAHYFECRHERFMDSALCTRVIAALNDMRKRGYKVER